ncbi:hypothetical protein K438DRAFT_1767673 [Mycena galopus ATCC 62051]|nr:hypothetical protein K438DRAFT_1767673 [Mycena galopus ATCC 62051]
MSNPSTSNRVETERDSRTYLTRRLRSGHGYRNIPLVDDALGHRLPVIHLYHARVVRIGGRSYLIWSPNSRQNPFYPGVFPPLEQVPSAVDPAQRRYDGYGGPADFTRAPQAYRESKPWLGFIVRESQCASSDVEYGLAYSVWENPADGRAHGRITPSHIEKLEQLDRRLEDQVAQLLPRIELKRPALVPNRPRLPISTRPFELLRQATTYEEAVDGLAEMNQWLREKRAWLAMATIVDRNDLPPPSRDDASGLTEHRKRIACGSSRGRRSRASSFIHALPEKEPLSLRALDSFVKNTEIARLLDHESYEFDRIAMREYRYTMMELQPVPYASISRSPEDGRRSSLRWQLSMTDREDLPLDRWAGPDEAPSARDRALAPSAAGPSSGTASSRAARSLDVTAGAEISLDPARVAWLRPPAIRRNDRRTWTTFRESRRDDNDEVYMRQLGQHSDARRLDEGDDEWYDRALQRRLIFEGTPDLESRAALTTHRAFDADPVEGDIGKVAEPPRAEQLPTLHNGKHEPHEGGGFGTSRTKRKKILSPWERQRTSRRDHRRRLRLPFLHRRPLRYRTFQDQDTFLIPCLAALACGDLLKLLHLPSQHPSPSPLARSLSFPLRHVLSQRLGNVVRPCSLHPSAGVELRPPHMRVVRLLLLQRLGHDSQPLLRLLLPRRDRVLLLRSITSLRGRNLVERNTQVENVVGLRCPTEGDGRRGEGGGLNSLLLPFAMEESLRHGGTRIPRVEDLDPRSLRLDLRAARFLHLVLRFADEDFDLPRGLVRHACLPEPTHIDQGARQNIVPIHHHELDQNDLRETLKKKEGRGEPHGPLLLPVLLQGVRLIPGGPRPPRPRDVKAEPHDDEMSGSSVFSRFGVQLEERVGSIKPHRYRKHNRTQKRLRREAERQATSTPEGMLTREEEMERDRARARLRVLEEERKERLAANEQAREEERTLQLAIESDI